MKKVIIWAAFIVCALTINAFPASAKDIPAGMRMEVASVEEDDNVFEIFSYKDEDGTTGYYLSVCSEFRLTEVFDMEILGSSLSLIKEVCLYAGSTPDDVYTFLDSLLELYNKDVDAVTEFPARMAAKADKLGDPTVVECVVKKKFIGGKYLKFYFLSGDKKAEADLSKSVVKRLRKAFKIGKK